MWIKWFSSVQLLSRVWLFATPWIAACQASLSITNSWSSLKLMSIELVMLSSHLILCHPLLLLPPIPPSIRVFPMSQLFASHGQGIRASASAPVLLINIQSWFLLRLTGLSPCSPKDSQESSSADSLLCSALWSNSHIVHDYWKNHSFDYTDLDQQSDVSAF